MSPTSKANRDNMFYVTKKDTRVDGPWTEKDVPTEECQEIKEMVLYPWQQEMISCVQKKPHDRLIDVLFDPETKSGKSWLKRYCRWKKIACVMPTASNYQDMMAMALEKGQQKCYIIDVPQKLVGKPLTDLWGAIESLKDGFCYDKRYKYREKQYLPSHVWVFTNTFPVITAKDRLRIWMISPENGLIKWTKERQNDIHEFHEFNRQEKRKAEVADDGYEIGAWKRRRQASESEPPAPLLASGPVSPAAGT